LPERLLPPHGPDDEPENPIGEVVRRALGLDGDPGVSRDRDAAEDQQPEHARGPRRGADELQDVGQGVRLHWVWSSMRKAKGSIEVAPIVILLRQPSAGSTPSEPKVE